MTVGPGRCAGCSAGLRPQSRFCPSCGHPVESVGVSRRPRRTFAAAGVAVVLTAAVVMAVAVLGRARAEPAQPVDAPAPVLGPVTRAAVAGAPPSTTPVTATSSCLRPTSQDSAGRRVSYEPARAVDGDPTTAWRCNGDGVGQALTLAFAQPVRISSVGVVPGLAKTDPADGTDRYAQNRRISAVRLDFGAGRVLVQPLDPGPARRAVQSVAIEPTVTRTVVITVLASVPGTTQNRQAALDTVAISEVVVR